MTNRALIELAMTATGLASLGVIASATGIRLFPDMFVGALPLIIISILHAIGGVAKFKSPAWFHVPAASAVWGACVGSPRGTIAATLRGLSYGLIGLSLGSYIERRRSAQPIPLQPRPSIQLPPDCPPLRRDELLHQLQHAAVLRSIVSMVSGITGGALGSAAALLLLPHGNKNVIQLCIGASLFLSGLLVSWLMTQYYCKQAVLCPQCHNSLWSCGTGNFKPSRMAVREDIFFCPHCGLSIE